MNDDAPARTLKEEEWKELLAWADATQDPLEDGAIARKSLDGEPAIDVYASEINKPKGWHYPFLEELSGYERPLEMVGRIWRDDADSRVHLEIVHMAAAKAVSADYQSGVEDMDDVAYEQAVASALAGTKDDADWLDAEYRRLLMHFRTRIR